MVAWLHGVAQEQRREWNGSFDGSLNLDVDDATWRVMWWEKVRACQWATLQKLDLKIYKKLINNVTIQLIQLLTCY